MQQEADRYTILAFSSDECRGADKWVGDHAFITIHGEGGEPLTFLAVDNIDGTTHTIKEALAFNANIEGSLQDPVILTMDETTDGIMLPGSQVFATTTMEGLYNLNGTRMKVQAETA